MKPAGVPAYPTFAEAIRVWFRVGLLSFGGPAAQTPLRKAAAFLNPY